MSEFNMEEFKKFERTPKFDMGAIVKIDGYDDMEFTVVGISLMKDLMETGDIEEEITYECLGSSLPILTFGYEEEITLAKNRTDISKLSVKIKVESAEEEDSSRKAEREFEEKQMKVDALLDELSIILEARELLQDENFMTERSKEITSELGVSRE